MTAPRFIGADELRARLGFEKLIEPMAEAFRLTSAGVAQNGLIVMFPGDTPEAGDVYVKSGALPGRQLFVVKVAPWFAANVREGRPQGGFLAALDSETGHTRAIFSDEHYLSDIRTAAAGVLAARLFAPARVRIAAVLGAGVQAYWQSLALHRERPFESLLIWARDPSKAAALAGRLAVRLADVSIETVMEIEPAVRTADVLVTATLSREPIVRGEWLRPGQHVTAVGADDPTKCELDAACLERARVFVDARETAAANGDVLRALQGGADLARLVDGEIGEVLAGGVPGRMSAEDITIAKLVGLGAQDVAAAEAALSAFGL